jgi:hypothetical protein
MGPKFFETLMGRRFIEGTIPKILAQILLLNKNLERLNELLEKEIEQNEEKDS